MIEKIGSCSAGQTSRRVSEDPRLGAVHPETKLRTAAMPAAVCDSPSAMRDCFVLQGVIAGFFASPRVVELQVHSDCTLSGSVQTQDDDNADFETFLVMDGTSVEEKLDAMTHSQLRVYNVHFQLTKRTDIPGLVYVVVVEGKLSRCSGLHGRWRYEADNEANARAFELPIRQPSSGDTLGEAEKSTAHDLSPLTRGSYALKGAAVGDNGYLYQATWSLKLQDGGVLEGSSTEYDNAPQVSRVEGSWDSASIHCTLFYEVGGVIGTYTYDGDAHQVALKGRWVNTKAPHSAQERGKFEFAVVETCRQWNTSDHKHYPKVFRDVVRLCLLSSAQSSETAGLSPRIPSHLWSEVFSYCGFDWFSEPE